MENLDRRMLLAGLGLVGAAAAASVNAGSLTPPAGPVAPTGKTTDEIEPRVEVQSLASDATAQFLINLPGSYYLTGNIAGVAGKAAIAINADNVTLDLVGFALLGVVGATQGVEIRGTRTQVVVRNGSIRGFGAGGVITTGTTNNAKVESVNISGIVNGEGIFISGEGTHVRDCELTSIGGNGIVLPTGSGLVEGCVVQGCTRAVTAIAITANTVVSCTVANIVSPGGLALGISASGISNCAALSIGTAGSAGGATGLSASGTVTESHVNSVAGGSLGSAIGIDAPMASQCSVHGVTLAGGSGNAIGIIGNLITDCQVVNISTASSGDAIGLSNYSNARMCTISSVSVSGSGLRRGCLTNQVGLTEGVTFGFGFLDVGIEVLSGQTISGCTTGTAVTAITATGTRNVIDGNNVIGASNTGIFVTGSALVIRNQVRNCVVNISGSATSQVGPIVSATGTIVSTNPWANFTD